MDLTSSRQYGFGEGPIPWQAINDYCNSNSIFGEQRDDLFYYIKEMDQEYLKIVNKEKSDGNS